MLKILSINMPVTGSQWKIVSAGLLFAVLVFVSCSWYVRAAEGRISSALRAELDAQKSTLTSLAQASSEDELTTDLAKIVSNCDVSDQSQFDTLLGNLGQLRGEQLKQVQQLFYTCARIYPEQKQLMAERINREVQQYAGLLDILSITEKKAVITTYPLEAWRQFSDMETKRGDLSRQLVEIQGEIIAALASGKGASSPDVQQMIVEGQHMRDSLSLLRTQENDLLKNKLGI